MKITCKICGEEFDIAKEDKYQVRVPSFDATRGFTKMTWDALDCPHCGCQNLLSKRYDTVRQKKRWI